MEGSSYHQLEQASMKVYGSCRRFWRSKYNEAKQSKLFTLTYIAS